VTNGQDRKTSEPVNARIFPLPPVVLLLFIGAGFGLRRLFPFGADKAPIESVIAGNALMVVGFLIAVLGAREMVRARTSFHPGAKAAALVTSGVYRRTRNPMYLSFLFFLIGLGLALPNPWLILLAPVLLIYMQERVIKREEAYLSARFGPEYDAYRGRVRRWF
jgi:protein-S-isoprenylcysteine O-methyltransferase Ste14